jgi:hypothetical protein
MEVHGRSEQATARRFIERGVDFEIGSNQEWSGIVPFASCAFNAASRLQIKSRSARNAPRGCAAAVVCAISSTSHEGRSLRRARKLSRMMRRMRLRTTARLETRRDTAMPRRGSPPSVNRYWVWKVRAAMRLPWRRNAAKSAGLRRRALGGWPRASGTQRAADQGIRCLRPFARRALRTARPPRVFMRARKPCVRACLSLPGWNVRFMAIP